MEQGTEYLTLADFTSAPRTKDVVLRCFGGKSVQLQELSAADVVWMSEQASGTTTKLMHIRVALTLAKPSLGGSREEKVAALDTLLSQIGESGWDELWSAIFEFQKETQILPTEELRRLLESIPELWYVLVALDHTHGWFKDLDDVTMAKVRGIVAWLELTDRLPTSG